MKNRNLIITCFFIFTSLMILQSHSDGRATRDRDNTGAPGGQSGGSGQITCQNCHSNASFEAGLSFELLDENNNSVLEYVPNKLYTAKVSIQSLSGANPSGYGFQMVSLIDSDDSDANGWIDSEHSSNVQLVAANSTGRVYAEHHSLSVVNEFTAAWIAPGPNSGDISFYIAGIAANANNASSGDHAPTPIKVTFSESNTTSTSELLADLNFDIFPNPVSERLTISGEVNNTTLEIYQSEKLVKKAILSNNYQQLALDELRSGLFYLVFKNAKNNIIATKKMVKQ